MGFNSGFKGLKNDKLHVGVAYIHSSYVISSGGMK